MVPLDDLLLVAVLVLLPLEPTDEEFVFVVWLPFVFLATVDESFDLPDVVLLLEPACWPTWHVDEAVLPVEDFDEPLLLALPVSFIPLHRALDVDFFDSPLFVWWCFMWPAWSPTLSPRWEVGSRRSWSECRRSERCWRSRLLPCSPWSAPA